uniref:Uncharacterized protein n=1 Tax=Arundo donax TaxID=35708 RepID=A0A0A9E4S5_ARUDO
MDILPSRLFLIVSCFLIMGILDEIILQYSHEDCCQKPCEEEDCNTRVYNGEPMNLQVVWQVGGAGILLHPLLKWCWCLLPLD